MIGNKEIESLSETFTKAIRTVGPVNLAFFIMLGALLYGFFFYGQIVIAQEDKLDRIESKLDRRILDSKAETALNSYFLRQICLNGADTEQKRNGCNPPPSLLEMAN